LGNVAFIVAAVLDKKREDVVVLFAGMGGKELGQSVKNGSPVLLLLLLLLNIWFLFLFFQSAL